MKCPECQLEISYDSRFCKACGCHLENPLEPYLSTESERKQVSILFSDLSGYTAITEKFDPEDVREIMDQVFGKIKQVVDKYGGFIEKYVGDSAMAVFGVPIAHEDDPVRAIRAAMEIHGQIEEMSFEVEAKTGQSLSMHSGINTGLVVTGKVDRDKGTHGLLGDTIALASRLEGLAKSGQILVGETTYNLTKAYFNFDHMESSRVKGKAEPLTFFNVLSAREEPSVIRHLEGVRAELIGRQKEIELLNQIVESLKNGQGSVISIVGNAGTGKSRLVLDFKKSLQLEEIQWREGHAYPYTQNTPYYPLINLLIHAFRIQDGDDPDTIRDKVEKEIKALLWDRPDIIPYIGSLFSLSYPEIENVNPEVLRTKLKESCLEILEALARRGPTVLWFEDLHWSDNSYIDLLHFLLNNTSRPVVFLLSYRPVFNLFPKGPPDNIGWPYCEIILQDLSMADSHEMLKSMLDAEDLPHDLERFISEQAEGNPFYLEEVINSLIETGTLVRKNSDWSIIQSISKVNIPTTIKGVLTARIDRLEKEAKRILQEASVIGRAFFYEVLSRITQLNSPVDKYLSGLESLDFIRARKREPDLEYIFKHALTQEVVYNGLLKKERNGIHEQIARVMEKIFVDRLPEFYDTLAYHFKQGSSKDKAAEYLIKAGEKSYKTLSNQEAKEYYQQAYELLTAKSEKSSKDKVLLMDLLFKWALLLYDFGDINKLLELFSSHEEVAESIDDKQTLGMFKAWLGFAYYMNGSPTQGLKYLEQALNISRDMNDPKLKAYVCAWLAWCHWDMGSADKVLAFAEQGYELSQRLSPHQYLDFKPITAMANQYIWEGRWKKLEEIGTSLIEKGKTTSNPRCISTGQQYLGFALFLSGKFDQAMEYFQKATQASADVPFYRYWAMGILGMVHIMGGQPEKAEKIVAEVKEFTFDGGVMALGSYSFLNHGIALFSQGQMHDGWAILHDVAIEATYEKRNQLLLVAEICTGIVFSQLAAPSESISFSTFLKNFFFLMKNLPGAARKAEKHFHKAMKIAEETNSHFYIGYSWMELGRMFKARKKRNKAIDCFEEAIKVFKMLEINFYLGQAEESLNSLKIS